MDDMGVFGGSAAGRPQLDPSSFTLSMSVLLRTLMNLRVAGCEDGEADCMRVVRRSHPYAYHSLFANDAAHTCWLGSEFSDSSIKVCVGSVAPACSAVLSVAGWSCVCFAVSLLGSAAACGALLLTSSTAILVWSLLSAPSEFPISLTCVAAAQTWYLSLTALVSWCVGDGWGSAALGAWGVGAPAYICTWTGV